MAHVQALGIHTTESRGELAARGAHMRVLLGTWCETHGWPAAWRPGGAALTRLVASFWLGETVLPERMGLSKGSYQELVSYALNGATAIEAERARQQLLAAVGATREHVVRECWALRSELAGPRRSEVLDLERLLCARESAGESPSHPSSASVARVLAYGCLGAAHLWRDLGLRDRAQLRALIAEWFPTMVRLNTQDMRWKRFFYRQLCELGGDYLCRAPSCDQCSSYGECFVPADKRVVDAQR